MSFEMDNSSTVASLVEDEIALLEKEIKKSVLKVKGLLKLRHTDHRDRYVRLFELAISQFNELQNCVNETQNKIDRELGMLHQVKAVIACSEKQTSIVKELIRKVHTPEILKAVSENRSRHVAETRRATSVSIVAKKEVHTQSRQIESKRDMRTHEVNDKISYSNPEKARKTGIYSKDKRTFNKYIL